MGAIIIFQLLFHLVCHFSSPTRELDFMRVLKVASAQEIFDIAKLVFCYRIKDCIVDHFINTKYIWMLLGYLLGAGT